MEQVRVYFETEGGGYAEQVATFQDEETYMLCLPALEKQAKEQRMIVTESMSPFTSSKRELRDRVFNLANELAISDFGNEAVRLHSVHNSML